MALSNIKSSWVDGNLVFRGRPESFVRFGTTDAPLQVKIHARPTTLGSTLEVRARPSSSTASFGAVDSLIDVRPTDTIMTAGYHRAIQGVTRVYASNSVTGGSLCGSYAQFCNNGTLNGAGILASAFYGLIEDGGTYTAVSHLAVCWLDSHLTKTVSAGSTEFLYISNNGSTVFNQAIYCYAGNNITNLLNIKTASGMVSDNDAGGSTLDFTDWRKIKIVLEDETYYLVAAKTIANS